MARTVIAPIVAVFFLLIKVIFGIDVPEHIVAQTVDVVASVSALLLVLIGIVQNHEKRPDTQEASVKKSDPLD